jgi:GNAT superfamily N-acetyltransferase
MFLHCSGQGIVVGLLKVGRKKLFVFDAAGAHHEMQALCVLDFYVHESRQRMGCGKALYEYMLRVSFCTHSSTFIVNIFISFLILLQETASG